MTSLPDRSQFAGATSIPDRACCWSSIRVTSSRNHAPSTRGGVSYSAMRRRRRPAGRRGSTSRTRHVPRSAARMSARRSSASRRRGRGRRCLRPRRRARRRAPMVDDRYRPARPSVTRCAAAPRSVRRAVGRTRRVSDRVPTAPARRSCRRPTGRATVPARACSTSSRVGGQVVEDVPRRLVPAFGRERGCAAGRTPMTPHRSRTSTFVRSTGVPVVRSNRSSICPPVVICPIMNVARAAQLGVVASVAGRRASLAECRRHQRARPETGLDVVLDEGHRRRRPVRVDRASMPVRGRRSAAARRSRPARVGRATSSRRRDGRCCTPC